MEFSPIWVLGRQNLKEDLISGLLQGQKISSGGWSIIPYNEGFLVETPGDPVESFQDVRSAVEFLLFNAAFEVVSLVFKPKSD